MKFVSWNVNGLRACLEKDFMGIFNSFDADIFALQETKMQQGQAEVPAEGYFQYWNSADKKGYSGTAVFSKKEPLNVMRGIEIDKHDHEGRVITLEFEQFYFVTCYTPNSQNELARLDYRMEWEEDFRKFLVELDKKKPVVLCGDLNVAHKEIDLKNPKTNRRNANGFCDSFRYLYPDVTDIYSWWSYRFKAREKNAGWRIDYFITSDSIKDGIKEAKIHTDVFGSDHCPVSLEIEI